MPITLYGYFRSSASYRVRIALNLKNLEADHSYVNLRSGEQHADEYKALNPLGLVPTLVDGPNVLTQSLSIIEYLDETYREPPLLPRAPLDRARVRSLALTVACEVHPLQNSGVRAYLSDVLGLSEKTKLEWCRFWIARGLSALEAMVADHPKTGDFCHGQSPTLADICLVPQIFNAERYDCPLDAYPTLMRIHERCMALPAFRDAAPGRQGDAVA